MPKTPNLKVAEAECNEAGDRRLAGPAFLAKARGPLPSNGPTMTENATAAASRHGIPGEAPASTDVVPGDELSGQHVVVPAGHGQKAAVFLKQAQAFLAEANELLAGARSLLTETPVDSAGPAHTAPGDVEPRGSVLVGAERARRYPSSRRLASLRGLSVLVVAGAGLGLSIAGTAGLFSGSGSPGPRADRPSAYIKTPKVAPGPVEPASGPTVTATVPPGTPAPAPLSVSVPRLRSSAAVVDEVSVQSAGPEKGLLSAPGNYHDLGWYRHGSVGVLVIDGHVGYHQDPGPLAYIGKLVPGDTVVVAFPGDVRSYRVTGVARALKGRLPDTYFSPAYDNQVMLITCDYTSTFSAGHFADNVYVVATPT